MKTISLDASDLDLRTAFREMGEGEVVYLTSDGEAKFAVVPIDEGDHEVLALRNNADFLAYLDACKDRAKTRPTKSLDEMWALYGGDDADPIASSAPQQSPLQDK